MENPVFGNASLAKDSPLLKMKPMRYNTQVHNNTFSNSIAVKVFILLPFFLIFGLNSLILKAQPKKSIAATCNLFLELNNELYQAQEFDFSKLESCATKELIRRKILWKELNDALKYEIKAIPLEISQVEIQDESATCHLETGSDVSMSLFLIKEEGKYKVGGYKGVLLDKESNDEYEVSTKKRISDVKTLDKLAYEFREGMLDLLASENSEALKAILSPDYLPYWLTSAEKEIAIRANRYKPTPERSFLEKSKLREIVFRNIENDSVASYNLDWNGSGITSLQFKNVNGKWIVSGHNDFTLDDLNKDILRFKSETAENRSILEIKMQLLASFDALNSAIKSDFITGKMTSIGDLCTPKMDSVFEFMQQKCSTNLNAKLTITGIHSTPTPDLIGFENLQKNVARIHLPNSVDFVFSLIGTDWKLSGIETKTVEPKKAIPPSSKLRPSEFSEYYFDQIRLIFGFSNQNDTETWEKKYGFGGNEVAISAEQYDRISAFRDNLETNEGHPIFNLLDKSITSPQFSHGTSVMYSIFEQQKLDKILDKPTFVDLTIERNGKISKIEFPDGLNAQQKEKIAAVFDSFAALKPAMMNGVPVRSIWRVILMP